MYFSRRSLPPATTPLVSRIQTITFLLCGGEFSRPQVKEKKKAVWLRETTTPPLGAGKNISQAMKIDHEPVALLYPIDVEYMLVL